MKVYVIRPNTDNADVTSIHATLAGARRAVEQAAEPVADGFSRAWETDKHGFLLVDTKGDQYRDVLFEITPFDIRW